MHRFADAGEGGFLGVGQLWWRRWHNILIGNRLPSDFNRLENNNTLVNQRIRY